MNGKILFLKLLANFRLANQILEFLDYQELSLEFFVSF